MDFKKGLMACLAVFLMHYAQMHKEKQELMKISPYSYLNFCIVFTSNFRSGCCSLADETVCQ